MQITPKEAAALDEHAPAMSQESRAFSRVMGEFIGVTEDHPAWLCFQADGIITVENFLASPDAYLMGLSQTVISKDSGGNNMKKQVLIQYIKRILLCWLKQFLLMLTSNFGNLLSTDDLNKIEKVEFDKFRMQYSEMPKLPDLVKPRTILPKSATPPEKSCSPVVETKMVVMQDATTYPLVKDDYPSSHSELQTQISEVFVANDSASLVNVHLVKGELPIDMEVNQEVKGESTTISSLPSHKVNNKVFQVLQSKKVNCIVINAISKSLLLEKLSLVPSHTISYVAALLHGFCSEHLSRELVEVISGPKGSGYASRLSNLVKMATLSTFPFDSFGYSTA